MLKGTVKDKQTGETLPFANVYISDVKGNITAENKGTAANLAGIYEFSGVGDYLTASYTGYKKQTKTIDNTVINFELQTDSATLPEVVISATPYWKYILIAILIGVITWLLLKK